MPFGNPVAPSAVLAAALILAGVTGAPLTAQSAPVPGQPVRVRVPPAWERPQTFTYLGTAGDTVLLAESLGRNRYGPTIRLPATSIAELQTRGRVSAGRQALGITVAAGVIGAGALVAVNVTKDPEICSAEEGLFCSRAVTEGTGNLLTNIGIMVAAGALGIFAYRMIALTGWATVPPEAWRPAAAIVRGPDGGCALRIGMWHELHGRPAFESR
jgi:hypothetical protein